MYLHLEGTPTSCLEVDTGGGWKLPFPGIVQEYSKMLLRLTLQQPTGPLQPCLRTLLVSARPLLVSAPWTPEVPRLLSFSPVLLCQESETAEHEFQDGRRLQITFPVIMQEYSSLLSRPTLVR